MTVYNKLSDTVGIKHVFHGSAGVMSPDHQQVAAVQHISTHDCRLYLTPRVFVVQLIQMKTRSRRMNTNINNTVQ